MSHRSHLTQTLANYFDWNDTRTRRTPWTLESQLFNSIVGSLEESQVRMDREVASRKLRRSPLNLDNRGCWYRVQVPPSVANPLPVRGILNGTPVSLVEYDDLLPVPSRVELDPSRSTVPVSSMTLWSASGTGLPQGSGALALAVPNRLNFWMDGLADNAGLVEVVITGYPHPRVYWASALEQVTEVLSLSDDGPAITDRTWESISDIEVRGLPSGASLTVFLFAFALPQQVDPLRPVTVPFDRDVVYDRRWRITGSLIEEGFTRNRWVGFNPLNALLAPSGLVSVVPEPNTYGMLAAAGTSLLYGDRREVVPDNLYRSAIAEEPAYGLRVEMDPVRMGDLRLVNLIADSYAGAAGVIQYRFTAESPDGRLWTVFPNGDFGRFNGNLGWAAGSPAKVQIGLPNALCGTWWFTLETLNGSGRLTKDQQPYVNGAFAAQAQLDVSGLVPFLAGAGYDSKERLWLWTGSHMVPVQLHYDAYLYDSDSRSVYLTDTYDQVVLG